ncbi:hypothetical protein [Spiroplasma endosymbiont of Lariophagus distinguendus]|uniref:hypothetical protein n=1 Tax=Spiroplasma endosymbiont of Lariophagus distinguendus TaxID=2935082 RepID=UPI00207A1AB3|nr:hypothetical protein [Spiroplasma endosymbiont of Lariophagus distinguendus]
MQKSKNLCSLQETTFLQKCHVHTDFEKDITIFKSVFTKHETVNHQDIMFQKLV